MNVAPLASLIAETAMLMNRVATPQMFEHLANLRGRWRDEREYEDFADYSTAIAKLFDAVDGVRFVKLSKAFAVEAVLISAPT